jgi:hypothetical protein
LELKEKKDSIIKAKYGFWYEKQRGITTCIAHYLSVA